MRSGNPAADVCRVVPVLMKGLDGVDASKVACGWRHSMVIDRSGTLYTCGWSKYGQLGHGDYETRTVPALVDALQSEKVCAPCGMSHCGVARDDSTRLRTCCCVKSDHACRLELPTCRVAARQHV